jgi:2-keto-4-pentenoate hydratase/2-oxohepta-3-ene-1,7-dioic acid hydratase in catechol pathway
MRLATLDRNGKAVVAVRRGNDYIDLSVADPSLPGDMTALIAALPKVRKQIEAAAETASGSAIVPVAGAKFLPVVPNPGKIICLGLNYADHAAEGGNKVPSYPAIFLRGTTSLTAHNAPIVRPKCSIQLDYEAELAVIIGKTAKHVSKDKALEYVAGYACFNEGSVREYQRKTTQWGVGKNFDKTGGFGPEIVTADEVKPGAAGLRIMSRLNGKTMQDGNTKDMIFDVATTISILSEAITLEAGDVIVSGTPEGVGHARKPEPVWMKAGDTCEIEIESIGTLVNPIVDEVV